MDFQRWSTTSNFPATPSAPELLQASHRVEYGVVNGTVHPTLPVRRLTLHGQWHGASHPTFSTHWLTLSYGKIRRYTSPDEHAFYPSSLPPLVIQPMTYPDVLVGPSQPRIMGT